MVTHEDEDKFDKDLINEGYCVKRYSLWYNKLVPEHKSTELCMPQYSILLNHKLQKEQIVKQLLSNTLQIFQEHANSVYYQCCYCKSNSETTNFLFSHLVEREHVASLFENLSKDFIWVYTVTYCPPCNLLILGDKYEISLHKRTEEHTSKMPTKYKFKRSIKSIRDAHDDSDDDLSGTLSTCGRKSNKRNSYALDDITIPSTPEPPRMLENRFCSAIKLLDISKGRDTVSCENNVNGEDLSLSGLQIHKLTDVNNLEQINTKEEDDVVNNRKSDVKIKDVIGIPHIEDASKDEGKQDGKDYDNVSRDRECSIEFNISHTLNSDKNKENMIRSDNDKVQEDIGDRYNAIDSIDTGDEEKHNESKNETNCDRSDKYNLSFTLDVDINVGNRGINDGCKAQIDVHILFEEHNPSHTLDNGENEENLDENNADMEQHVSGVCECDVVDSPSTLDDKTNEENSGTNIGNRSSEINFSHSKDSGQNGEDLCKYNGCMEQIDASECSNIDNLSRSLKEWKNGVQSCNWDCSTEPTPVQILDNSKSQENINENNVDEDQNCVSDHHSVLDPLCTMDSGTNEENKGKIVGECYDEHDPLQSLDKSKNGGDNIQTDISDRSIKYDPLCMLVDNDNKENLCENNGHNVETDAFGACGDEFESPSIRHDGTNAENLDKNDCSICDVFDPSCTLDGDKIVENHSKKNSDTVENDIGDYYNELEYSSPLTDGENHKNHSGSDCGDALSPTCTVNSENDNVGRNFGQPIQDISRNIGLKGCRKSTDNIDEEKTSGNDIECNSTSIGNGKLCVAKEKSIQIKGITNVATKAKDTSNNNYVIPLIEVSRGKKIPHVKMRNTKFGRYNSNKKIKKGMNKNCTSNGINSSRILRGANNRSRLQDNSCWKGNVIIPVKVIRHKFNDNHYRSMTNGVSNNFQFSLKKESIAGNKEEKQEVVGLTGTRPSYSDCVTGNKIKTKIVSEPCESQMSTEILSAKSYAAIIKPPEKNEIKPIANNTSGQIQLETNTNEVKNEVLEKNEEIENNNPITVVVYGIRDRLLDDKDSLEIILKEYAKVQRIYIYSEILHVILENREAMEELRAKKEELRKRLNVGRLNIIEVTVTKKNGVDAIRSELSEESAIIFRSLETLDYEMKNLLFCSHKLMENTSVSHRKVARLRWLVHQVAKKCLGPSRKVACHIFGSRITGIAFENSDVDMYVEIDETFHGKNGTDRTKQVELVRMFADAMSSIPEFNSVKAITQARVPIVNFKHTDTRLTCDLSFKSGIGVLNSTLVRTYLNLDFRAKLVLVGVKLWAKKNDLIKRNLFNTYSLTCMVFYFLMQLGLLPSVLKLRSILPLSTQSYHVEGWNCTFPNEMEARILMTYAPAQPLLLLKEFFKFYSDEALQHFALSTLLGCPVPKDNFLLKWESLPPCYSELRTKIKEDRELLKRMHLDFDGLCVQDPFEHSHNVTKTINREKFAQFRILCDKTHWVMSHYC